MKWDSALYDNNHDFVSKFGKGILSYLNPKPDEWILDLGCGTGDLTNEISVAGSSVIGVDYSSEMITSAKVKYPGIEFHQMDARQLKFDFQFDAIFSNAVLHWIPEKETVINQIQLLLKDRGRFVAEFGGKGNNDKMLNALKETFLEKGYHKNAMLDFWYYPSIGEYSTELEKQNFRVVHAEHFDRPTPLNGKNGIKDWFTMFGGNFFVGIADSEKENILNEVQNKLKATHFIDETWYADYKRIRVIAIKEN